MSHNDENEIKLDLQKKIIKIISDFDNHNILSKSKLIYHYTTCNGLEGIIKSKRMWMNHFKSLNDSGEVLHGLRFIKEKLSNINSDYKLLLDDDIFENFFKQHPVYIESFSEKSNYLPQWRYYAHDGSGVAIGIDLKCLESKINKSFSNTVSMITNVLYSTTKRDENRLKNLIENIDEYKKQNIHYQIFKNKVIGFHNDKSKLAGSYMILLIIMVCQFIKTSYYEDEYEYRIAIPDIALFEKCVRPGDKFLEVKKRFRDDFANPIEYIDALNIEGAIREIWVGPKLNFEKNKDGIIQFLKENEYPDYEQIEIKQSEIPYKNNHTAKVA